ncbi:hypothetical protein [Paraburkholderia sp. GAS82]|uniref:hypothetical protein n=1 Tax=Paraburkholderia sp. GAS82 TaxID=3035137 RepID=UPI003D1AB627
MQKLIIHIGAGKCGSSAIQAYLGANAASLRAQGVLIPGLDLTMNASIAGQQINFFLNLVNASPSAQAPHQPTRLDAVSIVRRRLAALKEEMIRSNLHTLVISAENLSVQHAFSSLFAEEKAHFDVHIVAYIRRQDEYLSSAWGQWYVKAYESIDEYLAARVPVDGDWYAMLSPWLRDFGRDRVHVRRFDRKSMYNTDVVDDFITITGLPVDASHKRVGVINESNDERLIALAHHVRDEFSSIHDTSFYDVMNGVLGKENRPKKSKPYLFDRTTRLRILDAYAGSNEKVKTTFFPEIPSDTALFPPPGENDVLDLSPVEKLEREVSMLTRIVYSLAKKLSEPAAKEIPVAQTVSSPAKGNPVVTQIIGTIAVPGSKVLREALSSQWYAERNQDVRNAGFDPYSHWCDFGMKEGRLPAPDLEKLMAELSAERNALSQQKPGPA